MFRGPFPIVYCADVERSVRFYREGFGYELTFRWPSEGGAIEYAFLRLGAHGLGLARAEPGFHGLPVETSGPRRFELCVYCEDTDAASARLIALGAKQLYPPTDQPWNERICYFEDPDGNPIHVTMELKPQPGTPSP